MSSPVAPIAIVSVGVLTLLAWVACRSSRALPPVLTILHVAATPAVLMATLGPLDVAAGEAFAFKAMAVTPLPVVLLVTARTKWPYVVALACGLVAAAYVIATTAAHSAHDAIVVTMLLVPTAGLLAAWHVFYRQLGEVGTALARADQETIRARQEIAFEERVAEARARWKRADLADTVSFLDAIASGDLDPHDPAVRQRARSTEHRLRQIIVLATSASLFWWWLAIADTKAQARGVELRARTVDPELADPTSTDEFGRAVLLSIDAALTGSTLTVSVLQHRGGWQLFIVGGPLTIDMALLRECAPHCYISRQLLGETTVVELSASPDGGGDARVVAGW